MIDHNSHVQFTLPTSPYKFGENDCFTLASWVRKQYLLEPFPDFSEIYLFYNEQTFNNQVLLDLLKKFAQPESELKQFSLVLLKYRGILNLATMVDFGVVYYNTHPTWRSIKHISFFIDSIWTY